MTRLTAARLLIPLILMLALIVMLALARPAPVIAAPYDGMLVHAFGPLARGRSDVMPRSRVSA